MGPNLYFPAYNMIKEVSDPPFHKLWGGVLRVHWRLLGFLLRLLFPLPAWALQNLLVQLNGNRPTEDVYLDLQRYFNTQGCVVLLER